MRYGHLWILCLFLLLAGCAEKPADTAADEPLKSADGIPLAYEVYGEGEIGVVLVHCWSCDQTFWENQVDHLVAAGYKVVTLDLPGHGVTGGTRDVWTIAAYGADVKTVADETGLQNMVIVGHSMGARVSLEAAALMPERVVGVISVDALHNADWTWPEEEFNKTIADMENDFQGSCGGFVRGMLPPDVDAALADDIVARLCDADPAVAIALLEDYAKYDEGAALKAAGVPVRAIISPLFPANIESNRKYNPDYDAYVIEGTGHFPHMENPEAFNAKLVEVLEALTAGRPAAP